MRPCELKSLRWSDVHFISTQPHVIICSPKTLSTRIVFLTPAAVSAFISLKGGSKSTHSGQKQSNLDAGATAPASSLCVPRWPTRGLRAACGALRDFRLYDLRKNWITRAVRASGDVKSVSVLAGCSPAILLKHYCAPDDDHLRDIIFAACQYEAASVQLKLIQED